MSSLTRAEASRRNGARSLGPVTPEGKARSSQNAVRHGMYSTVVVLKNESQELFDKLMSDYLTELRPETAQELDLVHDIVIARWRLNRIVAFETATLDHEMDRQRLKLDHDMPALDGSTRAALAFGSLADNSRGLALLNRYEGRLLRTIQKSGEALARLQEKRRAKTQKCEIEPQS